MAANRRGLLVRRAARAAVKVNRRYYTLDGHEVGEVATLAEWEKWRLEGDRQVALTRIPPGLRVSTIFLGVDHNFLGQAAPVLFETMVFDDYGESTANGCGMRRYCTWAQAEDGHLDTVDAVAEHLGVTVEDMAAANGR